MAKKKNLYNLKPEEVDAIINSKLAQFSRKGGNKSTNIKWSEDEVALRDSVIVSYIVENCCSREKTAQQIADRWDISIGTARRYVKEAIERFCQAFDDDFEHLKKVFQERCEQILESALTDGQKSEALKALDMFGKSVGVYTDKKDVSLSGDMTINFDFQ